MKSLITPIQKALWLLIAALLLSLPLSSQALDFTWEGRTYREVKIAELSPEGKVTLVSRKNEKIVVPRESLTGFLVGELKKFEEKQPEAGSDEPVLRSRRRAEPREQDRYEKAWIYGSASGVTKEGFSVFSSEHALPVGRQRPGGEYREPKKTKGGAPIYSGMVFVKGLSAEDNTLFDKVLWRDGYVKQGVSRILPFRLGSRRSRCPWLRSSEFGRTTRSVSSRLR
ncbi:MAG: hypothetical protein ACR2RV_03110 [Verrucomicrobiales bacterium]